MAELLSDEEIEAQLPDGWERRDDEIARTFTFDDYIDGVAFAQAIGEIAEHEGHHPTMVVGYEEVEVRFTTHEEGGITDRDVEMAKIVDAEG